jgi:hypothetical protein
VVVVGLRCTLLQIALVDWGRVGLAPLGIQGLHVLRVVEGRFLSIAAGNGGGGQDGWLMVVALCVVIGAMSCLLLFGMETFILPRGAKVIQAL